MAQLDKLKVAFRACRGRYNYSKFIKMIEGMGYREIKTGGSSGSRMRYYKEEISHLLIFHKPHGTELGAGTVDNLRNDLIGAGAL